MKASWIVKEQPTADVRLPSERKHFYYNSRITSTWPPRCEVAEHDEENQRLTSTLFGFENLR